MSSILKFLMILIGLLICNFSNLNSQICYSYNKNRESVLGNYRYQGLLCLSNDSIYYLKLLKLGEKGLFKKVVFSEEIYTGFWEQDSNKYFINYKDTILNEDRRFVFQLRKNRLYQVNSLPTGLNLSEMLWKDRRQFKWRKCFLSRHRC